MGPPPLQVVGWRQTRADIISRLPHRPPKDPPVPTCRHPLAIACLLAALALAGCGKQEQAAIAKVRARAATASVEVQRTDLKNLVQAYPKSGVARLLLGERLLADGDGAAAAIELQRALEYGAHEDQALPVLAEALLQSGQHGRVGQAFGQTRLADPAAQARLMAAVAGAELAMGNLPGAQTAVDLALQAAPQAPQALLAQARLAALDNQVPKAVGLAEAVAASHPGLAEAWVLLGDLHLRQPGGQAAARQAFEKAVAAGADLVAPRMALMSLHVAEGDLPGAKAHLAALQQRAARNINTVMADGQLAFVAGEHARAREVFQGLLRVLPDNVALLLTAGENELMMGSPQQAEAHFAKAAALAPGNPVARRQLAKAQLRLGQLPKALATLSPLVDRPDASAEVLAMAAEARMLNGEHRAAQALYDRLATLKPTDPRLRTLVANAAFGRSDDAQVFHELRSIASQDSGSTADLALVSAHLARGQPDAALKALATLERKQPRDPSPPTLRGQVLAGIGRNAEARQSFEAALAVSPAYFPPLAALAALDVREGQAERARQRFADVVRAQPKNATAMLALAEVLARQGAPAATVQAQLDAAIAAAPGDVAARVALVNHHATQGRAEAALAAAQTAEAALPDNMELLALLARCQLRLGQTSQALTSFGKMVTLQPRSPQGHVGMAEAYLAAGQPEMAQRSSQRALELAPALLEARVQAILVALALQQSDKALALARKVQAEQPGDAVGHLLEGEVLARQGQWAGAAAALRQALTRQSPGAASVRLYQVLAQGERPAEAEAFAAQWLRSHPGDVPLLFAMAAAAQVHGDLAAAQKHYERLLTVQADHALALNNLAMVRLQLKQPGARGLAERAVAAAPQNADLLDTLAQAQAAEGQFDTAATTQRAAVAAAPQAPALRLTLARILLQGGERAKAKAELDRLAALGDGFGQQSEVRQLLQTLGPSLPGR